MRAFDRSPLFLSDLSTSASMPPASAELAGPLEDQLATKSCIRNSGVHNMPSSVPLRFSPTYGRELDRSPGDPDLPNVANVRYRTNGLAPCAVYATAHSRLGWLAGVALLFCATAALAEPQCTLGEIPDQRPGCTPGEAATSDRADIVATAGGTYSQRHRLSQTPEVKRQVLARYGVPWADRGLYEDDHALPLCAAGSDSIANRWPQKLTGTWNAHDKDRLESLTCLEIRRGLDIAEAQARFLAPADWRQSYCIAFPTDPRCPR